jgi:autotransporter-associated beta strand protein
MTPNHLPTTRRGRQPLPWLAAWLFSCLFIMGPAFAQTLQWDANGTDAGVTDGAGTWNTTDLKWWNGVDDTVAWNSNAVALFGNGGELGIETSHSTITVSGTIQVAGLEFQAINISGSNRSYIFSAGTLQLADNAFIRINNGVTNTNTARLVFNTALAGHNITLQKSGSDLGLLTLNGTNTWSGTLTLANTVGGGGLFINVTRLAALQTLDLIDVQAGSSLIINYNQSDALEVPIKIAGAGSSSRGAIRFDTSRTLSGAITLAANATINANTTNAPVGTLTGSISESGGSRSLTINSNSTAGTLVLAGDNHFTGGVVLSSGVLRVGHAGAFNATSPNLLSFASNANAKTVTLDGFSVTLAGLSQAGAADVVTIQNASSTPATLTLANSTEVSFRGVLADGEGGGALTLVKTGSGTQILSGTTSTYSGGTVLQGGILRIAGDGSLGNAPATPVTDHLRFDGGTLQFASSGSEASPSLAATRGITLDAGGGTLDTQSNTTYYAGNITGSGGLVKNGTGRLILAGASDHTGELLVQAGSVEIRHPQALGNTAGGTRMLSGTRLDLSGGITVTDETLITPYLAGISGENTWAGSVQGTLNATLTFESAVTNGLTLTGDINAADVDGVAHSVHLIGTGSGEIRGTITNALTVNKNGPGSWTLSGDNHFTNGVNLTQGELILASYGAVNATSPNVISFANNANTKQLSVVGNVITAGLASTSATGVLVQNSGGDATLILQTGTDRSFLGSFTDGATGRLSLDKRGPATQTLGRASSHTGDTVVREGTLQLAFNLAGAPASQILGSGSHLVLAGGTLALTGSSSTANAQTVAGVTFAQGNSLIRLEAHGTTPQDLLLDLGTLAAQAGATVNFVLPEGAPGTTHGIRTSTVNGPGDILGGWATVGNDWATVVDGNIVAYTGYTEITRLGQSEDIPHQLTSHTAANIKIIDGGQAGPIQPSDANVTHINTLLQTATEPVNINLTTGKTLRLGTGGGIRLVAGAGSLTIGQSTSNSGILSAGGSTGNTPGTLIFTDAEADQTIRVNSAIQNNGTAGAVTVVKNGPGLLILARSNSHTYSGGIHFNGGTVQIASDNALGAIPTAPTVDSLTFNGGTLRFGAAIETNVNRGAVLLDGGGTLDTNGFNSIFHGSISGSGSLTKVGNNTLTLAQANTYDGVTYVNAGILLVSHAQALGSTLGGTEVASSAIVRLNDGVTVTGETLILNGPGNNQGNLQVQSGTATWAGDILIANNTARIGTGSGTATLIIDGVIRNGGASNIGYAGIGGGTIVLNKANTYTGSSDIIRGIIQLGTDNALPVTTSLKLLTNTVVTETVALDLNGHNQTLGALLHGVVSTLDNNFITNSQPDQLATLTLHQSANTTYSGRIEGNIALVKDGTGTLTLTSTYNTASPVATQHSYTGKTTIRGGTLALSGSGHLAGTPWIQIDSGATFSVTNANGGSYSLNEQVLSGRGRVTGHLILGNSSRLAPGDSSALAGDGSGRLSFEHLTLSGGDLPTLRATFQIGGTTTRLGDSFEPADVAAFADADTGDLYDSLTVSGSLNLNAGSSLRVELLDSYSPQFGDIFNLLDWGSLNLDADGVGGLGAFSLADLDLGQANALLALHGWHLETSHFLSHGLLYVVPEPGRALLTLLGLGGLLLRRRR